MTSTDLNGWSPASPEGADAAEWQHVLWRGLWHFPVRHGPVVRQPIWWPSKTMPQQLTAENAPVSPRSWDGVSLLTLASGGGTSSAGSHSTSPTSQPASRRPGRGSRTARRAA